MAAGSKVGGGDEQTVDAELLDPLDRLERGGRVAAPPGRRS